MVISTPLFAQKKAVLWDFDGCFCDSEYIHFLSYNKAFSQFGHSIQEEEYYETFTHLGVGADKEIERYQLSCKAHEIRELKNKYYWELIQTNKAKIFPEISKILLCLKILNIRSIIASNSPIKEIEIILAQCQDPLPIEGIVDLELGMRKKPHPDIFLKAIKDLHLSAEECLVIEDSERGLIAASSAHCEALWIQTHFSSRFETKAPYLKKITHAELLNNINELCKNTK